MEFKDRLRELRQERHLTQTQFSELSGIGRSVVGMYETGKRKPSFEVLELIADFFNVSMDYLTGKAERLPERTASAPAPSLSRGLRLSKKERELVTAYRTAPERVQKIVDLNLEEYWPKYIEPPQVYALQVPDIALERGSQIAKQVFSYIEAMGYKDIRIHLKIDEYKKLLAQKGVQRFLAEVIDEVELQQGDIDRAYDIIAEEVAGTEFKEQYVNRGTVGRRALLTRIRNRFKR